MYHNCGSYDRCLIDLTAADRAYFKYMAGAVPEHFFELHFEKLQQLERHERLYAAGKSAAVNAGSTFSVERVLGYVERDAEPLMRNIFA